MEEVKGLKCKTARISYLWNYFLVALIAIFLILLLPYLSFESLYSQLIFLILFSIILILFLEPEAEKVLREYIVTDTEVRKVEGIITKKTVSIPYQSVADIKTIKGVLGRIFNFGDVVVKGVKGDIIIKGIREPERITKIIENRIARLRGKKDEEPA
ncbi:MAG: hypothetical protein DRP00_05060 [Candidatus Aenigmatarchaeota archaeon]|nr:MAG: hypothetical protein DRP00_05060 [Candidatus Aenigmarchaeota archaeon]